jgi:hypothetical protein
MLSVTTVTTFVKRVLIPCVYGVSGWLITEVPVILNYVPATFDGYSTSGLIAGLAFIASGAYWMHNELSPYIKGTSSAVASAAASQNSGSNTPAPTSFALSISGTSVTPGSGAVVNIVVTGGTPGGNYQLFQAETNANITAVRHFDATGTDTIAYHMVEGAPLNDMIAADGKVDFFAEDETTNKDTNTVTIASS